MDIRSIIANKLKTITKALSDDTKVTQESTFDNYQQVLEKFKKKQEYLGNLPQAQLLSVYESRKNNIAESSEPIEGVFFIIDGKLVPDYYSECLFSEVDTVLFSARNKQNPYKRAMYHDYFLEHYISNVYKGILYAKMIPRGRIQKLDTEIANILIDKCYFNDEALIQQIVKLYRLPRKILVSNNYDYQCPACINKDINDNLMNYVLL